MLALGIDRDARSLRFALLETAGRAIRLVASWQVPLAPGADAAAVLEAQIAERCPRPPDAVATALAGDLVSHRILHLPFSDPGRLAATVPFELESQVPFELGDSVTTFTVLRRANGGADILAAIAARSDVQGHLAELKSAGLDPAIVDVGGIATAGLVQLAVRDALVVEMRRDGGVALLRHGNLEGFRAIDAAEGSDMEAEVQWSVVALNPPDSSLPPLVVTGAAMNGLANRIGAPATSLDRAVPAWAARAAGLVPLGVNVRTGDFVYHPPSEEAQKQLRLTLVLAGVVLLLALASFGLRVGERQAELTSLRDQIQRSVAGVVTGAAPGTERVRLQGAVEGLERRLGVLGGSDDRRAAKLDLLREITRAVPTQTAFVVEELSIDEQGVRLRARTDTYESVDVLRRALTGISGLDQPDIRDVKTGVDGKIEFRVALPHEKGP
jgi:Tfp pilus assembly protein PilN